MHGIFFRDFDRDQIGDIMAECYRDRVYDQFLRPGMTILEVGGNVGAVTLYLSQFAKRLAVVEPCNDHLEVLRRTVQFNQLHVQIIAAALAAQDGTRTLHHHGLTTGHSLVPIAGLGGELVECLSMTTLLDELGFDEVDFMKLDVEGAEFEILESDSFQKEAYRIASMAIECHGSHARLENALDETGFHYRRISGDGINVLYGARRENVWPEDEFRKRFNIKSDVPLPSRYVHTVNQLQKEMTNHRPA